MVVLEAYACGTPVLASRIGSLDGIVHENCTGLKFTPGDPESLANSVRHLWQEKNRLQSWRSNTRKQFDQHYSEKINIEELLKIYQYAIEISQSGSTCK